MFFHQKTLINTKYKCQKKGKVEHENSVIFSERYAVKQNASDKRVIT